MIDNSKKLFDRKIILFLQGLLQKSFILHGQLSQITIQKIFIFIGKASKKTEQQFAGETNQWKRLLDDDQHKSNCSDSKTRHLQNS